MVKDIADRLVQDEELCLFSCDARTFTGGVAALLIEISDGADVFCLLVDPLLVDEPKLAKMFSIFEKCNYDWKVAVLLALLLHRYSSFENDVHAVAYVTLVEDHSPCRKRLVLRLFEYQLPLRIRESDEELHVLEHSGQNFHGALGSYMLLELLLDQCNMLLAQS